jgi:two-component system response regulator YesN
MMDIPVYKLICYRMEKAKEMLQKNKDKLSDIAQAIGYKDVKYFIRIFKKNIGITPNDFRKYSTR